MHPPVDRRVMLGYVLERRLGSGANGEVWLGFDPRTHGAAAVKVLRPEVAQSRHVRRFFARERRAIARLRHPHIVPLYAIGDDAIAMAYLEGSDLGHRLHTPIEPAVAVHWAIQIASALAHAHERGVVHRDVKPSNVLLDGTGAAYLADFGVACILDDPEVAVAEDHGGTPQFWAPEQARGEPAGPPADQYALARTLLEMLCGGAVPLDPAAALDALPPGLPADLRDALRRATARAPGERFPSIADFAAAVASADLRGRPAPVRLAAVVRVGAPFRWSGGAHASSRLGPDLARADYRLSDLDRAGLLAGEACEAFRARTGYADFGWAAFGNAARLGSITDTSAYARASDLVVLVHGLLCSRETGAPVAAAICRRDAQAIVLAPDVMGSGESRFTRAAPERAHVSPGGLVAALLAWLDLLGLREMPTVLAGHSLGAVALLAATDEQLGERRSRVAISPVFPFVESGLRRKMRAAAWLLGTVGRAAPLRRLLAWAWFTRAPELARYTPEQVRAMRDAFLAAPPGVLARLGEEYAEARPAPGDRLDRCVLVVGDDDPVASEAALLAAIDRLGFPARKVHRLAATGVHLPHCEDAEFPEATTRAIDDIARVVGTMLVPARQGTPASTEVESTLLGSTRSSRAETP